MSVSSDWEVSTVSCRLHELATAVRFKEIKTLDVIEVTFLSIVIF